MKKELTKIIVLQNKIKRASYKSYCFRKQLNNNSIPINILKKKKEHIFNDLLIKND